MMRRLRSALDQRGTSTLEFIVVLPTLLFVMFASVELSRAWFSLTVATSAAREGARTAVVAPASEFPGSAVSRMNEILSAANLSCAGGDCATVTCSASPCEANATVTATVTVDFQTLFPVFLPMLDSLSITQTASMRFEGGA